MSFGIALNQTGNSPFLSLPNDLTSYILNFVPHDVSRTCKTFKQLTKEKAQYTGQSILKALENNEFAIDRNAGKHKDIRRVDLSINRAINPIVLGQQKQPEFFLDLSKITALAPNLQELRLSGREIIHTFFEPESCVFKHLSSLSVEVDECRLIPYCELLIPQLMKSDGSHINRVKITNINQSACTIKLLNRRSIKVLENLERLELNNYVVSYMNMYFLGLAIDSIPNKLNYLKLNRSFGASLLINLLRKGNRDPNVLQIEEADPVLEINKISVDAVLSLLKQLPEYAIFKTIAVFERIFGNFDLSCKITKFLGNISSCIEKIGSWIEEVGEMCLSIPINIIDLITEYFAANEVSEALKIFIAFAVFLIFEALLLALILTTITLTVH